MCSAANRSPFIPTTSSLAATLHVHLQKLPRFKRLLRQQDLVPFLIDSASEEVAPPDRAPEMNCSLGDQSLFFSGHLHAAELPTVTDRIGLVYAAHVPETREPVAWSTRKIWPVCVPVGIVPLGDAPNRRPLTPWTRRWISDQGMVPARILRCPAEID